MLGHAATCLYDDSFEKKVQCIAVDMPFGGIGLRLTLSVWPGSGPSVLPMKLSLVAAGLSLGGLAVVVSACNPSRVNTMDPMMDAMVQQMLTKMGVPGQNSKPSPVAKSLDCPAIKSVIKHVEDGHKPISPASVAGLNAWAKWCGLPPTKAPSI